MKTAAVEECPDLDAPRRPPTILPGLINAHDHLHFALFPRLGAGPYPNATAWARDIYHPEREPIRSHLRVPKRLRLLWGGLRNLLSGVTTVGHHDPFDAVFDEDVPGRGRQALRLVTSRSSSPPTCASNSRQRHPARPS